jgi:replicative DNA helicase Mcm
MDQNELSRIFYEFFESNTSYYSQILERIRKKENWLIIDFNDLAQFSLDASENLLEHPENTLKAARIALNDFEIPSDLGEFAIRFFNLPESQRLLVKNIRSKHLGKLFFIEGVVRQKSDVRPQVTSATFECPSCGNLIKIPQLENKFREPAICNACGRKGKFKMTEKVLIDAQGLVLEESSERLTGGEQPKRVKVFLSNDLTSSEMDFLTNPGNKIIVVGIPIEIPLELHGGVKSIKFDIHIDANFVLNTEEKFGDVDISEEDEEKILELSKKANFIDLARNSMAPGIYGHDDIKEAILLQYVGGVKKKRKDGVFNRGDIHLLLIGDPGAGKSQLLKRAAVIAPKSRYVSGKGASGAGLTASVVKDEFLGGWSLEAGALVLANQGICLIDELDKMTKEDRSAMHEALEQQTITISKANIQATLKAQTTVLAAANPKMGRFNIYESIATQIDLPPALISRFDLIFPVMDIPDSKKDAVMARFILEMHKEKDSKDPPIETEMLRKYIAYARERVHPNLSEEAIELIQEYYVSVRNAVSSEGDSKSMPITPRQLEALIRLSEASAKMELSNVVKKEHAKRAISLLEGCLKKVGVDPSTGKVDIDILATGISSTKRNALLILKEILHQLTEENEFAKIDEIKELAKEKNLEEAQVDEFLVKLKNNGEIYEPRRGHYKRTY